MAPPRFRCTTEHVRCTSTLHNAPLTFRYGTREVRGVVRQLARVAEVVAYGRGGG